MSLDGGECRDVKDVRTMGALETSVGRGFLMHKALTIADENTHTHTHTHTQNRHGLNKLFVFVCLKAGRVPKVVLVS